MRSESRRSSRFCWWWFCPIKGKFSRNSVRIFLFRLEIPTQIVPKSRWKLQKRKRVPQKRLVDSLQNQVYNIFRHSRVLTDSVANNIFTIPMEDNYVIVLQPRYSHEYESSTQFLIQWKSSDGRLNADSVVFRIIARIYPYSTRIRGAITWWTTIWSTRDNWSMGKA